MSDQSTGPPGHKDTYVLLSPISDRGRAALAGPTWPARHAEVGGRRIEHADVRATLSRLRSQGLIVMRQQP